MELAPVSCSTDDPAALAAVLSVLVPHAPATATAQAPEFVRAGVGDREWTPLMAAIEPLPV
jgi:hypothetical protein